MKIGKPCLKVVKESAARPTSPKRDVALTLVVAAILFAGAFGSVLPPQTATAVVSEIEAAKPSSETVYFPSQYVNQGREIHEPTPTF